MKAFTSIVVLASFLSAAAALPAQAASKPDICDKSRPKKEGGDFSVEGCKQACNILRLGDLPLSLDFWMFCTTKDPKEEKN
ncbi:hypothetical protein PT974_11024 [Cladobotryum mycophilum]|uniref:Uncharacterized protein n=1 Tax=Cladobotryum mycophilum TaxID=491253 RepID=A0ABR0SBF4_9HYPO